MNSRIDVLLRPARRAARRLIRKWARVTGQRKRLAKRCDRLQRQIARLQTQNAALSERNSSIEQLSAELMRFNIDLTHVSRLDSMTGLLNRAAFEACLSQEHAAAVSRQHQGNQQPYSLIMIDVDHFKSFNDTFGHPAGDRCLMQVAETLRAHVRQSDFVGRYGGEEMIVLCPGMDRHHTSELAERLRLAIRELHLDHPGSTTCDVLTVSLGIATGPGTHASPKGWNAVVLEADQNLYVAKKNGRDRVVAVA